MTKMHQYQFMFHNYEILIDNAIIHVRKKLELVA